MRPIIRLAGHVARSNFGELSLPYKLTFAVTYRCQLRCGMCNIWRKEPRHELTVDEIAKFFRGAPGFSWINLSGGEIFLRPDIGEIFRVIAGSCKDLYLFNFPTNGQETGIIVGSIGELVRSACFPKLMVTVSLDGPPDLHDRIRSSPGSWERAVETYRGLRELTGKRFEVYFGMTLQDGNVAAFEETVAAVRTRMSGISHADFHVNVMQTSHYYGTSGREGIRDRDKVIRTLAEIRRSRKRSWTGPVAFLEHRFQTGAEEYLRTGRSGVACQALGASLFLDPAGTVYPCTMFDSPLGNLRDVEYDLGRLWTSERRQKLREDIRKGNCPQCWTPCEAYQSILAELAPRVKRN